MPPGKGVSCIGTATSSLLGSAVDEGVDRGFPRATRIRRPFARHNKAPCFAWSTKRYLNIELLKDQQMRGAITA